MKEKFQLNNWSIKNKLIIVYIFCVLIPLIITDSIVYFNSSKSLKTEQKINLEHVVDRVKYNLTDNIESCISASNYLYSDPKINDLITTNYKSNIEFYDNYNTLFKNNEIWNHFNLQKINKVKIYSDNYTIINSANVQKLDEKAINSEWYKQFESNNKNMTITVNYDSEDQYLSKSSRRVISVVRKLDYFKDGTEKILKIDMNYNDALGSILNEQMDDNLYVCNNDSILFFNKGINYPFLDYENINNIENKDFRIEGKIKFTGIREPWNIIIEANKVTPISNGDIDSILIILIIFNLLLPTIIIAFVSKSLVDRVEIISKYLDKVEKEEFQEIKCTEGNDEIGKLIKSYNLMVIKIKELIEVAFKEEMEKKNLELAKNVAELKALQSQVNPHFMFNTLESIRMRSLIKEENETANIIEKLSVLLRITINWGADSIRIKDEMSFVENYLEIQKYRFGEKISYVFEVEEDCKDIKIPKLSILSFVENACVHGLEGIARNGKITVKIHKEGSNLVINVHDTGIGMSDEKLKNITNKINNAENEIFTNKKGIGMLNSYLRLKKYSDNKIQFSINSILNEGTVIIIKLDLEKLNRGDFL